MLFYPFNLYTIYFRFLSVVFFLSLINNGFPVQRHRRGLPVELRRPGLVRVAAGRAVAGRAAAVAQQLGRDARVAQLANSATPLGEVWHYLLYKLF